MIAVGDRIKHLKRGTTYKVIGHGEFQTSSPFATVCDGAKSFIYQSEETGATYIRPIVEFAPELNKFEKLEK